MQTTARQSWTLLSNVHFHFFPADDVESVRVMLDLECDAVRRRSSLRSFASFKRCASNFWYSAASSRFFVARRRFCAKRWRLRCRTSGVTRRWIFGAFVLAFLPTIVQQHIHITASSNTYRLTVCHLTMTICS